METCTVIQSQENKPLTLKANILRFLETGRSEIDDITPDQIDLARLKLEVDSMATILQDEIKHEVFGKASEDLAVTIITSTNPSKNEHLHEIAEHIMPVLYDFSSYAITEMSNEPEFQDIIERADFYREAYFKLSPASGSLEIDYISLRRLIGNGFVTLGQKAPEIIKLIELNPRVKTFSDKEKIKLIKESGHMLVLLANLGMADFMSYSTMSKFHASKTIDMINIDNINGREVAHFDPKLSSCVRQYARRDQTILDHRDHTGCPGTKDLDGTGSMVSLGFSFFVNVAERTGYFG